MYIENCRRLHTVVDKIESEARDYLAIRDRVREAQIGGLKRYFVCTTTKMDMASFFCL